MKTPFQICRCRKSQVLPV